MSAAYWMSGQLWVERLGWTLLHFLWQGVLILGAYTTARRSLGLTATPNARYLLACAALAVMMAAPLVTFGLMGSTKLVPSGTRLAHVSRASPSSGADAGLPASVLWSATGLARDSVLTWVVRLWLAGAIAFWLRLICGWVAAARMRSTMVRPAPPEWQRILGKLGARIGLSRHVGLLVAARVQVPTAIGWLRPVVLLPIGALTGLPPEQMEAVLVHELAHIRRHDYLVNILQSVSEALLFYHPAVWWVSGHIRTERELCCDDVAVSVSGDALAYACALAELESSRPAHFNVAVAANGSSLEARIGRLLDESRPLPRSRPGPSVVVTTAILMVIMACALFGQFSPSLRFEVASIKPNTNGSTGVLVPGFVRMLPGGRLTVGWAVLRTLIQEAYGLKPFQVGEGPDWMDSEHYDIEAKAPGNTGSQQMLLMLQLLLEDRFKLKVHRETRELPVYVMTVANSGPKLQPSKEGSCFPRGTLPPPPPLPGRGQPAWHATPPCGRVQVSLMSLSEARLVAGKVSMSELTEDLSNILGRPVIDKTVFTGTFDVDVAFIPNDALAGIRDSSRRTVPAYPASGSIFRAIEEQLGLKLQPGTGPVEFLVIDHVEKPIVD